MSINRKRSRRLLFQRLYSQKYNLFDEESFYESFYDNKFTFEIDKLYIDEITEIINNKSDIFNKIINKFAPKFNVEKMGYTYLLPIYIALSEMFFLKEEIPAKVSINEAIELSKIYADDS
jgi:N utilization substance protein B